jgi:hypothetical protein
MYQRLKNYVSAFLPTCLPTFLSTCLPSVAKRLTSSPRQNYWALFFQTILNGTATSITFARKPWIKRLCGLRLLKRNAFKLPSHILISTYCTHIRPIVEYTCQVWHYGLPQYLSDQVEKIQKRALKIIFPGATYMLNVCLKLT